MTGRHSAATADTDEMVVTATVALALSAMIQAAVHGKRVGRRIEEHVFRGTARGVSDIHGMFADKGTPVLNCYLRVTLDSGSDTYWPMADLVRDHAEGLFVIDIPRP